MAGFIRIAQKLLGVGQVNVEKVLEELRKDINNLGKVVEAGMSGVKSELEQTRTAFNNLKASVNGRVDDLTKRLQEALATHSDTLTPEAQASFDSIQADMLSLGDSLKIVTTDAPAISGGPTGTQQPLEQA